MGKVMVILLIAAVAWVGWTIHTEGTEHAFGGILAPVESVRDSESMGALGLTPAAQAGQAPVQRDRFDRRAR